MPFYHKFGNIPHKRHTQFKKSNGKLYCEEVMGLEGFSSIQSTHYHHFLTLRIKQADILNTSIDGFWYYIYWKQFDARCWVTASSGETNGELSGVEVLAGPNTPVPTEVAPPAIAPSPTPEK